MAFGWTGLIIQLIVSTIIVSPVLWLVGRWLIGKEKAKFTDAIWIVVLGVIIWSILGNFIHGTIGFIVTLIIWLGLIKHFFDCGWLKAFLIAIIAVVVFFIITAIILALFGIAILSLLKGSIGFMI